LQAFHEYHPHKATGMYVTLHQVLKKIIKVHDPTGSNFSHEEG
jgi:hypothetical protein